MHISQSQISPTDQSKTTHHSTTLDIPLPLQSSSFYNLLQILLRYHKTIHNKKMFRISNTLVGTLNILTLLLSLAGMAGSAYIHFHKTDCLKVLMYPLLFGAFFIFVVSVLGITGSMFRINEALYAYLLATFFVILAFMLFTVFALFVTNKVVGQKVSDKGFGEYKVADFSLWLQQYVINDKNWNDIKSCLVGVGFCHRNLSAAQVSHTSFLNCSCGCNCNYHANLKYKRLWPM